ncbi:hypothetical protein [Chitinilyticum litopenaei]|uniref:hypothetical protein n=1 Tax=Chitinilyticum litopenaei TaxID=1121276 RepID=UPI0003FBD7F5|nr:hypothetical protein [Chitinilyticum litopenaei]
MKAIIFVLFLFLSINAHSRDITCSFLGRDAGSSIPPPVNTGNLACTPQNLANGCRESLTNPYVNAEKTQYSWHVEYGWGGSNSGSGGQLLICNVNKCTDGKVINLQTGVCEAPNSCAEKAGKSAGSQYVPVPCVQNQEVGFKILDKQCFVTWSTGGMESCDGTCAMSGDHSKVDWNDNYAFSGKSTLYVMAEMKYTGQKCSGKQSGDTVPQGSNGQSQPEQNSGTQSPKSQNDCPPGTTFGKVNNKPMCVKNAPKPSDPPSPNDGKACASGDCKSWDVDNDGNPGGKSPEPGNGGGVNGDGQQGDGVKGGGTTGDTVNGGCTGEDCPAGDDGAGGFNIEGFSEVDSEKIYQSKYKDKTFGKIWDENKEDLIGSNFIQSVKDSFPSFGGSGSMPSLTLSFSAIGLSTSHQIQIPPEIVAFIKACLIITACFTARKIIW